MQFVAAAYAFACFLLFLNPHYLFKIHCLWFCLFSLPVCSFYITARRESLLKIWQAKKNSHTSKYTSLQVIATKNTNRQLISHKKAMKQPLHTHTHTHRGIHTCKHTLHTKKQLLMTPFSISHLNSLHTHTHTHTLSLSLSTPPPPPPLSLFTPDKPKGSCSPSCIYSGQIFANCSLSLSLFSPFPLPPLSLILAKTDKKGWRAYEQNLITVQRRGEHAQKRWCCVSPAAALAWCCVAAWTTETGLESPPILLWPAVPEASPHHHPRVLQSLSSGQTAKRKQVLTVFWFN